MKKTVPILLALAGVTAVVVTGAFFSHSSSVSMVYGTVRRHDVVITGGGEGVSVTASTLTSKKPDTGPYTYEYQFCVNKNNAYADTSGNKYNLRMIDRDPYDYFREDDDGTYCNFIDKYPELNGLVEPDRTQFGGEGYILRYQGYGLKSFNTMFCLYKKATLDLASSGVLISQNYRGTVTEWLVPFELYERTEYIGLPVDVYCVTCSFTLRDADQDLDGYKQPEDSVSVDDLVTTVKEIRVSFTCQ